MNRDSLNFDRVHGPVFFAWGSLLHFIQGVESTDYPSKSEDFGLRGHERSSNKVEKQNKKERHDKATYFPNTVYFLFKCSAGAYVMKNCDPFEFGPRLAMDTALTK